MRTIDTVLFDLDDTLHDDTAAYQHAARVVAEELARDYGVDAEAVVAAYDGASKSFWHGLAAEHLTLSIGDERVRMWDEALRGVGIDDPALAQRCGDRYVAARADVLVLAPGAPELLDALRARGCKTGLVTNGFAATHHTKIDLLGLRDRMDAFFLADEVGMVKPDPRFFAHACAVLGSDPAHSAMVGDRYDRDITGARAAGLFTVLIDVHAIPLPLDAQPPDRTVATIADVLGVLPLVPPRNAAAG